MTEYGNGGTKDKKIMFISLGVLCVIFLVVTAFVWSSVNRQNQDLANSVSALESQIKTMKASGSEEASSSEGASAENVEFLRKEVTQLSSRVDSMQQNAQKAEALAESGLNDVRQEMQAFRKEIEEVQKNLQKELRQVSAEGNDARAKLLEGARKSLAFQKEFLQRLEILLNSQEKLMASPE